MMPEATRRHRGGLLIASCLAIIGAVSPQLMTAAHAQTEPVTLTVGQVITVDGSTVPSDETFTYRLTSADAPLPPGSDAAGYTFTITGTAEVVIELDVGSVPVSSYELSCITGAKAGYKVDTEVFTIDVYQLDDQPPITLVHLSDGTKTPDLSFTHHYDPAPQVKTGGTVLPAGATVPVITASALLLVVLSLPVVRRMALKVRG